MQRVHNPSTGIIIVKITVNDLIFFNRILLLGLYALNKSDHNPTNFVAFYNDSTSY